MPLKRRDKTELLRSACVFHEGTSSWRANQGRASSIAVPIMHGKRVVGCLNIIWIDSAMTFDTAVRRYLPLLRKAALRIETQYAQVFA